MSPPHATIDAKALDGILNEALTIAPCPLPRIAAVVALKDRVLWSGAGGKRTYFADPAKPPEGDVTTKTPFAMFSSTKFVTVL